MNNINLMGRLTKDPQLKQNNISTYTHITLAVKRPFSKDKTDFIDCVAFGRTAETITNYVKKGDLIGITGILQTSTYNDDMGNNKKSINVAINNMYFTYSANSHNNIQNTQKDRFNSDFMQGFEEISNNDELPF